MRNFRRGRKVFGPENLNSGQLVEVDKRQGGKTMKDFMQHLAVDLYFFEKKNLGRYAKFSPWG